MGPTFSTDALGDGHNTRIPGPVAPRPGHTRFHMDPREQPTPGERPRPPAGDAAPSSERLGPSPQDHLAGGPFGVNGGVERDDLDGWYATPDDDGDGAGREGWSGSSAYSAIEHNYIGGSFEPSGSSDRYGDDGYGDDRYGDDRYGEGRHGDELYDQDPDDWFGAGHGHEPGDRHQVARAGDFDEGPWSHPGQDRYGMVVHPDDIPPEDRERYGIGDDDDDEIGLGSSATRNLLEWAVVLVGAVLVALLLRAALFQAFWIPSESMEHTLEIRDRVLVNKLSYRLHDIHRGDVVVFTRPDDQPAEIRDLIKRVIGLPGETIEGQNNAVYVNGNRLDEPYLEEGVLIEDFGPIVVPADEVFVMGDNRDESYDSRRFGTVAEDRVVGRAFVLFWPLDRVAWL